jgi:hypothetical protein
MLQTHRMAIIKTASAIAVQTKKMSFATFHDRVGLLHAQVISFFSVQNLCQWLCMNETILSHVY